MNNKKTAGRIIAVIVGTLVIGISIFLFSYTYTVSGQITDVSSGAPIKGVTVVVAGDSAETDKDGRYAISGIKIYQRKPLQIAAPDQYIQPDEVEWRNNSRKIEKDLSIEPTLEEIVNRSLIGAKNGQYDYLWDLMHPDDKEYWKSKDDYKNMLPQFSALASSLSGSSVKSFTIGKNIRKIDSWKSPITGKEYQNVVEVPIDYVLVADGKESFRTDLRHYQQIDGFYHYFINLSKEDIKNALDAYGKLNQ